MANFFEVWDHNWHTIDDCVKMTARYYVSVHAHDQTLELDIHQTPKIREWIIANCEKDVYVSYGSNDYRKWIIFYFKSEQDAAMFKLVWMCVNEIQ